MTDDFASKPVALDFAALSAIDTRPVSSSDQAIDEEFSLEAYARDSAHWLLRPLTSKP